MDHLPFHHPSRPPSRLRPLKAFRHFRKLVANKEDTEQVFHIVTALRGRRFTNAARAFWKSESGYRILAAGKRLPEILDDHAALRSLPAGSVGRAYLAFMEREGLTAAGLEAEYAKFAGPNGRYDDVLQRYADRLRDTHDMMHVMTGYGRDALGEACVLAFTHAQSPNLGMAFIARAGAFEMKRRLPQARRAFEAIAEAKALGAKAATLAHIDIEALLKEPLEAARARLGFAEPQIYHQVHAEMRAGGLDPYHLRAEPLAS